MRILILGGTRFLGRALVDSARERGHELTLFNRGQSNPDLYADLEQLRGDRDGGLGALEGRRWDAVIDTCVYVPRLATASARLLAGAVDHYTVVSSLSVYSEVNEPGVDETGAVGSLEEPSVEEITGETYGPLKVLCERAVEEALPGRTLVVRPGLIVGPHDPTDRFTYWPHRMAEGGEVLAPAGPERVIQFIDVRDLADWMVRLVEDRRVGVFNATGPSMPLPMGELLEVCRRVTGRESTITWVDEEFLGEHEVEAWTEMPVYIPLADGEHGGFFAFDVRRAVASGLRFRPLEETVRDTLAWVATRPADYTWRAGIDRAREAELLRAWHERTAHERSAVE